MYHSLVGTPDGTGRNIYRKLFDRIIRREYKPGAWLREDPIAEEFGVSRTPVREALSQLTQDRLVKTIPKRGSQVIGFSVDDLEEAYEIRRVLEVLALERGINTLRIAELAEIRVAVERAREQDDPTLHARVDARLHELIIESAHSPRLAGLLGSLYRMMQTFREIGFTEGAIRTAAAGEHLELIDAIATRDVARARALLSDHIAVSKSRVLSAVLRRGL